MEKTVVNRIKVASYSKLPEKVGKAVLVDNYEIAIFKLASGKVKAIENRCPHKGGVLAEGIVSGEHVFCPMHDWKICLDSGNVQAPDTGCVKTYKTEVIDNDVYIFL